MTLRVRPAGALDARDMADLLTTISVHGDPLSADILRGWMATSPGQSAWHVAEDDAGQLLGLQWIAPHPDLPPDTCDIATFVRPGDIRIAVGSALFDATRTAARALGYRAIIAVIREDNSGGLAYYQSRGFENWGRRGDDPTAPRLVTRYAL